MSKTPLQKNSSILRPRARIIKTIGEELISNDIVAIIELVKNCYDANATIIEIKFEGYTTDIVEGKKKKKVLRKQGGKIIISDDGTGMDLNLVKNGWMEPATINKKYNKRSYGGKRRNTGEKGIGRFASAKLGTTLKMITKSKDDNEIVVDFNWSDFSDDTKYLDQIECTWEVREPQEIKDCGTTLILEDLNNDWDEEKIRELRIALSRLINPIAPVPDFLMDLVLPKDLSSLSGLISSPESLNKPDYSIKGSVDENGKPIFKYFSKTTNIESDLSIKDSDFVLRNPLRKSVVGPFEFEIRVWDRESESLKKIATETGSTTRDIKRDLDALGGISIYRDNFRVLPYGEQKNDWLRLDLRRVNNPTLRLSNNQIVGYISISLDKNPELKDQSNREGLVESQAFSDLKELLLNILNQVEQKRYEERPRESDIKSEELSLFSNFSIDDINKFIQNKFPHDKEAAELINKTETRIKFGVVKVQETISRYRRLSTLGLLVDVILHDGNNFLGKLDSEVYLLSTNLSDESSSFQSLKEHIDNINNIRKVIAQLFKRLEPFGGRKRGRPKNIIIETAIKSIFSLYMNEFKKLNIGINLPDSSNIVRIDEGELQMIFVNLIQNSLYWLETVSDDRKIVVSVDSSLGDLSIIFSDSGPGINEQHQQLIFDPYFSTKPSGVGLGLTIIGEVVTEYNGEFSLIDNGPLDGATFKIIFRKRV